jgi:hypothetical protein
MLSLTMAAALLARPRRLVSNLEYLKAFHGACDWSGQAGFEVTHQCKDQ